MEESMFAKRFKKLVHWLAIVMVALPINMLSVIKVEAASENITKIVFTTLPQSLNTGEVSAVITVQTQNADSTYESVSEPTYLNLNSDSTTGSFSTYSSNCSNSTWYNVTQLTMNSSGYNKNFCYKDTAVGTHTLTVSAQGQEWTSAIQTIIIAEGNVVNTTQSTSFDTVQEAINVATSSDIIKVKDGTYTEDLSIPSDKSNLEITSYNGKSVTKIKGVSSQAQTGFPDANSSTNIDIKASGTKIHDLTIESPDVADGYYASGMVITGDNSEIFNNNFITKQAGSAPATNDSNTNVIIQTYSNAAIPTSSINGLNIHNNSFSGTPTKGYYGVYINPTTNSDSANKARVVDNIMTGTIWKGITVERSNVLVSGNSITTDTSVTLGWNNTGIQAINWTSSQLGNIDISSNTVTGNGGFKSGIDLGYTGVSFINIIVSGNTISKHINGVRIRTDAANIILSQNNISDNQSYALLNNDSATVLAENNYWGSADPDFTTTLAGSNDHTPWWTTTSGPSSSVPIVVLAEKECATSLLPTLGWSLGGANPDPIVTITINGVDTTLATKGATSYTPTTSLSVGNNTWKVKAVNAMGESISQEDTFFVDATVPNANNASITINSGKEVTNEKDVTLTITGDDEIGGSGIDKMKISQELVTASTIDQSVKGDWIDFATAKTFTLTTDKDGNYTVYMQLKDKAGNISSIISDTIFYSSSFINNDVSNPTVDTVNSTDRVIDQIKDNGLYLEVTNKTTGDANIVIGEYEGTPIDKKPTGISVMGKTFEIKTDNDSVFPIALKFYYTQADLTNAGITDETKIVGIYYYDSATDTWGLYSDTGVYTSNTTIDGIEYQGYVWANLDHLTPLAYGADQTAPKPPANFQVTIVNKSEVKLSWNKVDEAEKYTIRYKKNAIGQEFTYVSIDKINTSTSVINLNGATEYVFEIASVDKYNNYSDYSSQIVTTKNAVAKGLVKTKELVKTKTSFVEVVQAEEEGKGEVKATTDESKDEGKEESRALVTIIILLIALAAGVGGYYGYEYWMLNNQKKTTRKNGKKSGRW